MTRNFPDSIPEFFYDLLGLFLPGLVTIEMIVISPVTVNFGIVQNLSTFERILFLLSCSYIVGQMLTIISDLFVRRPVWFLFGEPSETLLGSRKALIRPIPKVFESSFLETLKTEMEAVATGSLTSSRWHSRFDLCEQYIKQRDHPLGLQIQKRHAVLVMCRNMVVALVLMLPLYWSLGYIARFAIVISAICLFLRWSYLRTRRAEFLYNSFHLTFIRDGLQSSATTAGLSNEPVANRK